MIFRSTTFQTWITHKTTEYLSKELKTEITIGGLDITWFLDVVIEKVNIKDLHGQNLLSADKIIIDFKYLSIRNHTLVFDNVSLVKGQFNLYEYLGDKDFNIQFIADYLKSNDTIKKETSPTKWRIKLNDISIKETGFHMMNENRCQELDTMKGINFYDLMIYNVNADIKNFKILGDTISADIKDLSCYEQSGFGIKKLSTNFSLSPAFLKAENLKLITKNSDLDIDLRFLYKGYECFDDFINKVNLKSLIRYTSLDFTDIAYFAPPLFMMANKVKVAGIVTGTISNLKVNDFVLKFGNYGQLFANVNIKGLPDITNTYFNINFKQLQAKKEDIEGLKLPGVKILLPIEFEKASLITVTGAFKGYYNQFHNKLLIKSSLGTLQTNLDVKTDRETKTTSYIGKISATKFLLGKLLNNTDIGSISLLLDIKGSGLNFNKADIELRGKVDTFEFKRYSYNDISINGRLKNKTFSGNVFVSDANIDFNLTGLLDFSNKVPIYDFKGKVTKFIPNNLNLIHSDSLYRISGNIDINLSGTNIDNLNGYFLLNQLDLYQNNYKLHMNELSINSFSSDSIHKKFDLSSDFINASIQGDFKFKTIFALFSDFIRVYIPSISIDTTKNFKKLDNPNQNISFDILLKNINPISKLFLNNFEVSKLSKIKGNYDAINGMWHLNTDAHSLKVRGIRFDDIQLLGNTLNGKLKIECQARDVTVSDSIGINNFKLISGISNDSVLFLLQWEQKEGSKHQNKGLLEGNISFSTRPFIDIVLRNSMMIINDSTWNISQNNHIRIDSSVLHFQHLEFFTDNQKLTINGLVSKNIDDKLDILFKDFNVSNIDIITNELKIDFDGFINGNIKLNNLYETPNFVTNLTINGFAFNGDKLGDLFLNTNWNEEKRALYVKADVIYTGNIGKNTPISVEGFYYPFLNSKKENFDLSIDVKTFRIKTFASYLSSFSTIYDGKAIGTLHLGGITSKPELTGLLSLSRVDMKINFLNTNYTFASDMIFEKDWFGFKDLVLNDVNGKKAIFNGRIYHNAFKDFRLDLTIKPDNMMLLNTDASQNETFYGKAFGSGIVKIYGPTEDITFDINAKTTKGTKIFIPISSTTSVSQTNFIKFKVIKDSTIEIKPIVEESDSRLLVNIDLNVNEEALLQIDLNYETGGSISANGSGNMKMKIDSKGEYKMYGEYTINEGNYFLNLENLLNKNFKIDKGSTIKWNGNIYDAQVDINAVYTARASLYELKNNPLVVEPDTSRKRIPINCIIALKGSLFNPEVSFDIEFPTLQGIQKEQYEAVVNSNLNFQFVSLLVLNSFIDNSPDKNSYSSSSSGSNIAQINAAEALSNQLSSWLSQISKDFDIGVKYRPGTSVTTDELEVALSTQLFKERLLIDGNIGVGGSQRVSSSQKSNNIVGDVNIEYKITEDGKLRIKAFNRSNNNTYTLNNSPNTQGLGLFYRKEFDNLKELFTFKKKKKKAKN